MLTSPIVAVAVAFPDDVPKVIKAEVPFPAAITKGSTIVMDPARPNLNPLLASQMKNWGFPKMNAQYVNYYPALATCSPEFFLLSRIPLSWA